MTQIDLLFARETRWFSAILLAVERRDRRMLERAHAHHGKCIDAIRKHREFRPFVLTVDL